MRIAKERVTFSEPLYQFFREGESLMIYQKLYYSDKNVFNHYKHTHQKNRRQSPSHPVIAMLLVLG